MAYSNTISILISAKDEATAVLNSTAKGVQGVSDNLRSVGQNLSSVGGTLTKDVTLPIVGAGIAATKVAADFQQSMELIRTQAGASQREVDSMTQSVLALAPAVGQGPKALADALFYIESSGIRGAQALDVLKLSAEGANVGQAGLADTANALTSAMNSQIEGAQTATEAMGNLNAIVGAGKMHFQDLNDAISSGFLETAKLFGISLDSVGAALATLTRVGEPASQAATRLRMAITLMAAPTAQAAKALEGIGISADEIQASTTEMTAALAKAHVTTNQLAADMQQPNGLNVAIADLRDHLQSAGLSSSEAAAVIARAFGGGRTSGPIMALVQSGQDLTNTFNQITETSGNFADSVAAQNKTASQQFRDAWASTQVALVYFGNAVMPAVVKVMGELGNALRDVGTWFQRLAPWQKDMIVTSLALAAALGPVLYIAGGLVTAISALISPVTLVVIGIGLLAAGAIYLYTHFKGLRDIASDVSNIMQSLGNLISNILAPAWDQMTAQLQQVWNQFDPLWRQIQGPVTQALKDLALLLATSVVTGLVAIIGVLAALALAFVKTVTLITEAGEAIGRFVARLAKGIADIYQAVAAGAKAAYDAVIQSAKAATDKVVTVFADMAENVSGLVKRLPGDVENAFKELVRNAPQWGRDAVDAYKRGLLALYNYDVSSIIDWAKGVARFYDQGVAAGKQIIHGVEAGIRELLSNVEQWGRDIVNGVRDGFNASIRDVQQWGRNLVNAVSVGFSTTVHNAQQWGRDIVTNIRTGLTNGVGEIITWFRDLPKLLEEQAKASGQSVANHHVTGMSSVFKDTGKMKQLGDDILKGIGIALAAVIAGVILVAASIGIAIINFIIQGLKDALHLLIEYIPRIWDGIAGAFEHIGADIVNWAVRTVDSVVAVFTGLPSRISNSISSAFSGALNGAKQGAASFFHDLHIPGFAAGTNYAPGGVALVGEHGPELVTLPQGAKVTPNAQTNQAGSKSVNIAQLTVNNNVDIGLVIREIGWQLALR